VPGLDLERADACLSGVKVDHVRRKDTRGGEGKKEKGEDRKSAVPCFLFGGTITRSCLPVTISPRICAGRDEPLGSYGKVRNEGQCRGREREKEKKRGKTCLRCCRESEVPESKGDCARRTFGSLDGMNARSGQARRQEVEKGRNGKKKGGQVALSLVSLRYDIIIFPRSLEELSNVWAYSAERRRGEKRGKEEGGETEVFARLSASPRVAGQDRLRGGSSLTASARLVAAP